MGSISDMIYQILPGFGLLMVITSSIYLIFMRKEMAVGFILSSLT